MAELYSIRCYYNTGFNAGNRPADISVLNSAAFQDFDSNFLRQQRDRSTTRIRASWDAVKDSDYVRIGDAYYLIISIAMLSDLTAELSLEEDPILTLGGLAQIGTITGWLERGHVAAADDTLFANTLAEPWAPTQPLALDAAEQIGEVPGEPFNIVLSTVKLEDIKHVAEVYETETGSAVQGSVTVPSIPPATSRCVFGVDFRNFVYPAGSFYHYDADGIADAINDVRSLGIDSAIVAAYQIPRNAAVALAESAKGLISAASGSVTIHTPSESLLYKYGSIAVKNQKVYAMFNEYVLLSSCSGDRASWKAEDIYSGGDAPQFREFFDCSPTGRPYMQPVRYHGAPTMIYQECVKGEEWYRLPFAYTGVSGSLVKMTAYNRRLERQEYDILTGAASAAAGVVSKAVAGNLLGAISQTAGEMVGLGKTYLNVQEDAINYQTQQKVIAPEIAFPQEYGAQAFLGNVFFIYRTRLSDSDMIKCDLFFTAYGYAQDKQLDRADFYNRTYFNFVKTRDANISGPGSLHLRQAAADVLNRGVRLWHVLPNPAAMIENP